VALERIVVLNKFLLGTEERVETSIMYDGVRTRGKRQAHCASCGGGSSRKIRSRPCQESAQVQGIRRAVAEGENSTCKKKKRSNGLELKNGSPPR